MSEKSNIQHLRDILEGFNKTHGIDLTEAHEFLDAAEEEERKSEKALRVKSDLEERIRELEDEYEESVYANEDFVGLDTIRWDLQNGNLVVMQQMEGFIARLQHQNAVTPS